MRFFCLIFFLGLSPFAAALEGQRPVISMITTCAQLSPNFYPTDTTAWFEIDKNPQVVFFAHMLFPLGREAVPTGAWHPPLVTPVVSMTLDVSDRHYAQAQWLDPDGLEVAHMGITMSARVSTQYLRLGSLQYIPHTFSSTLGIKDLRVQAGQKLLLSKNGQYHIRFSVDGCLEGIAFFRIFGNVDQRLRDKPTGATLVSPTPGLSNDSLIQDMLRLLTRTAK
jgi:hypothetical protein